MPGPPLASFTASSSIPSSIPVTTSLSNSSSTSSHSLIPISSTAIFDPTDSIVLINTHPMIIRSKRGIHKPKVLKVVANYTYQEPPSFVVASRHP